ncbi:MAG TPA: methionine ABC transporter permease, partial [Ruminococcaceae bacterium]|nr:methionine ABC transporter permease [Oscillospiraceae bacterium]
MLRMMLNGIGETLYMVAVSTFFAYVIGLPLGIMLVVFAPGGARPHPRAYKILDVAVNLAR